MSLSDSGYNGSSHKIGSRSTLDISLQSCERTPDHTFTTSLLDKNKSKTENLNEAEKPTPQLIEKKIWEIKYPNYNDPIAVSFLKNNEIEIWAKIHPTMNQQDLFLDHSIEALLRGVQSNVKPMKNDDKTFSDKTYIVIPRKNNIENDCLPWGSSYDLERDLHKSEWADLGDIVNKTEKAKQSKPRKKVISEKLVNKVRNVPSPNPKYDSDAFSLVNEYMNCGNSSSCDENGCYCSTEECSRNEIGDIDSLSINVDTTVMKSAETFYTCDGNDEISTRNSELDQKFNDSMNKLVKAINNGRSNYTARGTNRPRSSLYTYRSDVYHGQSTRIDSEDKTFQRPLSANIKTSEAQTMQRKLRQPKLLPKKSLCSLDASNYSRNDGKEIKDNVAKLKSMPTSNSSVKSAKTYRKSESSQFGLRDFEPVITKTGLLTTVRKSACKKLDEPRLNFSAQMKKYSCYTNTLKTK